jgi:hypothetical protein
VRSQTVTVVVNGRLLIVSVVGLIE